MDKIDKTNISNDLAIEMLKLLEKKPKIKVLVVEKAKIEEKVTQEMKKKMNLEISNNKKGLMSIKEEKDNKIKKEKEK